MDYFSAMVRLGGNVQNTVFKRGITAAEIEILKAKHGDDGVVDIEVIESNDTEISPANARELLAAKYGRVVYELYPGARPNLPSTAKEIGVETEEAKPKKTRSRAKPAPKVEEVEATAPTEE